MAEIIPFRGLRFNAALVGNLSTVTTPPYDVIDQAAQETFYRKNPYNIIRLELGKTFPSDTPADNRYTRAAAEFNRWLKDGVLCQDPLPAFYLYQQEFPYEDSTLVRSGFICGVKLVDYTEGMVLPHEETLPKHKADRLELMRACHANFSSIFGLYNDPAGTVSTILNKTITEKIPDTVLVDESGTTHRLWVIDDQKVISDLREEIAPLPIYIADGHHRYETALLFRREMETKGVSGYEHVMMTLVSLHDPGLVVFPTHRLVKDLPGFHLNTFLQKIKEWFTVEVFRLTPTVGAFSTSGTQEFLNTLKQRGFSAHTFGFYPGGNEVFLLSLKEGVNPNDFAPPGKSAAWANLDVSVLHTLILEPLLGIGSQERASERNLAYTRDAHGALEQVATGKQQMAFLLNPTRVEQVTAVASAGDKMPQKSTYFFPKLLTGLVINPLG